MDVKQAKELCIAAHTGQFRNDGIAPYHTHPFAVADMMITNDEKVLGYLHDVVEDTSAKLITGGNYYFIVFEELEYSLTETQYYDLLAITKIKGVEYQIYLCGISDRLNACKVKIADMFHNLMSDPAGKQKLKYTKGITYLLSTL